MVSTTYSPRRRKEYLDLIRILALILVLYNHTGVHGFTLFTQTQKSALYPVYLFSSIAIKIAVPLFFMVSGTLLLGREESYSQILRRFFRFFSVLLVASFLNYLYQCFRLHRAAFSVSEFLAGFYQKPTSTALWYLYVYLAYILMLPFSRCLAKNLKRKDFNWLFLCYGFMRLLPILEYVIFRKTNLHYKLFSLYITTDYLFYPLLGYYLGSVLREDELNVRHLFCLSVAGILSIALCAVLTHHQCTMTGNWAESDCQTFFNTLIFLPAAAMFYALRLLFLRRPSGKLGSRFLAKIGGATFGAYLIEEICRSETQFIFVYLQSFLPMFLATWVWIIIAFTVGVLITLLFKLIPGVSKFI